MMMVDFEVNLSKVEGRNEALCFDHVIVGSSTWTQPTFEFDSQGPSACYSFLPHISRQSVATYLKSVKNVLVIFQVNITKTD